MCRRSSWFHFIGSNSLFLHGKLNHIKVASCHMFTLADWLTCINVGGGCYRVVSEHGSTLGLDGWNFFHAYTTISYVFFTFMEYVLILYAW